jgi:hypothetical protein
MIFSFYPQKPGSLLKKKNKTKHFESGSNVTQAGLELLVHTIILPQPPEYLGLQASTTVVW